jgi:hypothetical protein
LSAADFLLRTIHFICSHFARKELGMGPFEVLVIALFWVVPPAGVGWLETRRRSPSRSVGVES